MVLAVNPLTSGSQTAAAFKENAKSATQASATASSTGNLTASDTSTSSPSTTVVSPNATVRNLTKGPLAVLVVLVIRTCMAGL